MPRSSSRDASAFILLAAAVGTAINATFDVVGLCYDNVLSWNEMFSAVLQAWWVPNALGMLLVAPLILAWSAPTRIHWNRKRILELVACASGLIASCAIAFNSWLFHGYEELSNGMFSPFHFWSGLDYASNNAAAPPPPQSSPPPPCPNYFNIAAPFTPATTSPA